MTTTPAAEQQARDKVEQIRWRWTDNGILAREGFPERLMAHEHVTHLLAEVSRLRAQETRIRALGAAWGENSLFASGDIADILERHARELLAALDTEGER